MSEETIFSRSYVWDVRLKYHPAAAAVDEGSPILTLTVTADNYVDAIDGALWAAIDGAKGRRIGATEDNYEVVGVEKIRGCTVV